MLKTLSSNVTIPCSLYASLQYFWLDVSQMGHIPLPFKFHTTIQLNETFTFNVHVLDVIPLNV